MILAVDVGNTNIIIGLIEGQTIRYEARVRTESTKTSDEYCIDLMSILDVYQVRREDIEGSILASVVPQVLNAMRTALKKLTGKSCLVVGPGIKTASTSKLRIPLSPVRIWLWAAWRLSGSISLP